MFDEAYYRTGYSIGVGGVVFYGDKVLLVRALYGEAMSEWSIPGGFVERGETIDRAVQREVLEETGVTAEVRGLIAARNRVSDVENSAYFIFLLHADAEEARADGVEMGEARYFTLPELHALPGLRPLTRMLAIRALEGQMQVLTFQPHPAFSPDEYVLFL